ncbi:hypothetical protein CISG_02087 [Coccidioides immitis RMSCC 3703]|uniref:Nucleolar protein 9 n=1 Tax=Coccidioides immitis RMSCC 3703 TaxID=454286 RepID=A0A0J8R3D6_COCIT|nr:hypothetical protein CISG_02087 [Coccidioides immitis RMSCC 3703]
MDTILREVPSMVERSRLNLTLLNPAYGEEAVSRLKKILKLDEVSEPSKEDPTKSATNLPSQQLHGSLLAQAMLRVPGPLAEMIRSSFLEATVPFLLDIAKSPTGSRVLQESLIFSKATGQFRRQIIPKFSGHLCELALNTSGSHVVDILWQATSDLLFLKQRLADELVANEKALRDSFLGRAVWRNWSMDLYKRKRGEWMSRAKGLDLNASTADSSNNEQVTKPKSKLDLARERFAAQAGGKGKETRVGEPEGKRKRSKPERKGSRPPYRRRVYSAHSTGQIDQRSIRATPLDVTVPCGCPPQAGPARVADYY